MSQDEGTMPPDLCISETDSAGRTVTWVATEAIGSMESHRRMLELLFSPELRGADV